MMLVMRKVVSLKVQSLMQQPGRAVASVEPMPADIRIILLTTLTRAGLMMPPPQAGENRLLVPPILVWRVLILATSS